MMRIAAICLGLLTTAAATAEDNPAEAPPWKPGAAPMVITPETPLPMAGYASRKEPALRAGYSNFYDGYIPSRRVLLEGGYEAQSRPWAPTPPPDKR